jgi:membrane-associated phospholipid phosphatase
MLDNIVQIDHFFFHYLNGVWRASFLDTCLPYCRDAKTWLPLYLFILYYTFKNYQKFFIQILLVVGLSVALSDSVSSHIIKPLVHRLRPCNEPYLQGEVVNLIPCGSGFSFTSSHAANHFALAMIFSLLIFPKNKLAQYVFFAWASLVAYSQVYVGVHYPIDVLSGALLGIAISKIVYFSYERFFEKG